MRRSILNLCRFLLYPKPRVDEMQLKCRFKGRWVVITGASRGIGAALAKRLMRAGANLYLVARSETELQDLCNEAQTLNCKAICCALDLRDRSALKLLCHELEQLPQVDYLFCNAGKSICRKIADATERLHDFDRTMDLNYRSVVALALTLLPALRQIGGQLVYTSSVALCIRLLRAGRLTTHRSVLLMSGVVRQNANGNRLALVSMWHIYHWYARKCRWLTHIIAPCLPIRLTMQRAYCCGWLWDTTFPTSLGGRALRFLLHGRLLH